MSEIGKKRTRILIEICTRSLFQMIVGAADGQLNHVEDGRKSLEEALVELAGAK